MTDLPTVARPRRPIPGEDPEIARLTEMVVTLLGELTVMAERLDTVERLFDQSGVLARGRIEHFVPDPQAMAERDARRRGIISAVLRPLRAAAETRAAAAGERR